MEVKRKEESWLRFISKELFKHKKLSNEAGTLIELCEYYRLVRNSSSHGIEAKKEMNEQYKKIENIEIKKESKFVKLSAPNEYKNINFDDFIMYARSSQLLATILYKNIVYDYEKLFLSINPGVYMCFVNNTKRLKGAVYSYIKTNFNDDGSLDDKLDDIIKQFYNSLV